ncbi:shikimate kinase [Corynebacterium sp. sy017]|uniref:shikimate kinase n=1 Tax=unclassified Corynebacterium TaxID=2624378 RepID=UPI00118550FF|nr:MULTISPECIES: shikimate kinase [unclassified Corynebacterium]MBP3087697.1 shikimate kinase [Corynebacterium sp. sy017]QDZ43549.1 shikimate kinase [Corynebacterium sp. sy039]TSD92727.1 shikimate kinase [Corynebacterium sp. SY003]
MSAPIVTRPIVVLVGPPGAGKSTVGRRLARALHKETVDTDTLIEQKYGKKCGEVFHELGEEKFREVEAQCVQEALRSDGVVSLGGGAVITEATRQLLKSHVVVWIDITAEEGVRRTLSGTNRPILQANDPISHYRELLKERRAFYREVSRFRVHSDRRGPQKVVADILGFIETGQ